MSLAHFESFGGSEREPRMFRYSVKADRALANAIAVAAREAGLSVESFVQAHFDRILDAPVRTDPVLPDAPALAASHGIPVMAARIYLLLASRAQGGIAARSLSQLAADMNSNMTMVARQIEALTAAGLVADEGITRGGRRYRVSSL